MNDAINAVSPDTSVQEVARKMETAELGVALVMEHGRLAGIVTDFDLVTRLIARQLPAESTPIKSIMTAPVEAFPEDMELNRAWKRLLQLGHRHIPVVDETYCAVGILHSKDVLSFLGNSAELAEVFDAD